MLVLFVEYYNVYGALSQGILEAKPTTPLKLKLPLVDKKNKKQILCLFGVLFTQYFSLICRNIQ